VEIFPFAVGHPAVDRDRVGGNCQANNVLAAGRGEAGVFIEAVDGVADGGQIPKAARLRDGAVADVVKAVPVLLPSDRRPIVKVKVKVKRSVLNGP
jgi:hypothetical protein